MKEIVDNLRNHADYKKRMIGTTAPTYWLKNHSQKEWDKSQKEIIKNLYKAARILEATL